MKLTTRQKYDLEVLLYHAQRNINYGSDGSYVIEKKGEWVFDKEAAKKTERAIKIINDLINDTKSN